MSDGEQLRIWLEESESGCEGGVEQEDLYEVERCCGNS